MNKKKFLIDSILNVLSTAMPLIILQFYSLPKISSYVGSEKFGEILVLISLFTLISTPLGSVLNNLRLLKNKEFLNLQKVGDLNYIFSRSIIFIIIIFLYLYWFIKEISIYNIIFIFIITLLYLSKEYFIVAYRIEINYKNILINNLILSIGYLVGTFSYSYLHIWELIYITGLLMSFIHVLYYSNIYKESYRKTEKFKENLIDFLLLYISGLVKGLMSYGDKILLLPLLGARNVAIFYSANIIGRMILVVFNPINNVLLSYLVKGSKINIVTFFKAFLSILAVTILSYFVIIYMAPLFLYKFYFDIAEESLQIIQITTATSVISLLSIIFHPFNLRFNKLKWQIYMNASNLFLYLIIAIGLTLEMGLYGFCLGGLISAIYKFLFQFVMYFSTYFTNQNKK